MIFVVVFVTLEVDGSSWK